MNYEAIRIHGHDDECIFDVNVIVDVKSEVQVPPGSTGLLMLRRETWIPLIPVHR